MIQDRAIVGRLNFSEDGVIRPPEYLCFDPALLTEVEWYWSAAREKAFVFDHHSEADARAIQFTAEGMKFCHAAVLGSDQLAEERKTRHRSKDAALDATVERFRVSPQEAHAALEKRGLA